MRTQDKPVIDPYLDRAEPQLAQGKIKQFCRNQLVRFSVLPFKNKAAIVLTTPALLVMLSVSNRVMNPELAVQKQYTSDVQKRVAYESLDAPLNFLDITGAEYDALTPQSQVDYLLGHLTEIENRLLMHTNENYTALVSFEAARLRTEAIKEASSVKGIDMNDPTGTMDISFALDEMQPYQVVLLRYAGDAIARMGIALRDKKLSEYTAAVGRYHAALYALNDLQPIYKDPSSLLILSDNYRVLLRKVVARSPASQRPPVAQQGAGMTGQSPVKTFVDQQGYKSEQLGEVTNEGN